MDFATQPHTSFIPKAPLASTTPSGYQRRGVSIFSLISIIIFITAIALSAGVFLYKQYQVQNLADKKASLERARAAFEPALIQELGRLDKRIEHAKGLLSRHAALSLFFKTLGESTLQNVQFKSLSISADVDGKTEVHLNGIARSYASVALQSDAFGKTKGLKSPMFSALNLDQSGNVAFSVSAFLDSSVFSYESSLQAGAAGALEEIIPSSGTE